MSATDVWFQILSMPICRCWFSLYALVDHQGPESSDGSCGILELGKTVRLPQPAAASSAQATFVVSSVFLQSTFPPFPCSLPFLRLGAQ